ncbi:MAG: SpoVA/SpoVAEb family sporulation membrane protein, partial [Firmicutes bacterium]|nr:SpoVA/SpoVAEb family sporulation membrane protein [Bacillota bacterium]
MWTDFLWAFLVGGLICAVAQLMMDLTPFTVSSAHVLVSLILIGEILGFFGIYQR